MDNLHIEIYTNNYSIDLDYLNNYPYKYSINEWKSKEPDYLSNLVFPKESHLLRWSNLQTRPFKICPINKSKLLNVSNNSILNICVFDSDRKIVGFVVVLEFTDYYWIEIICTNVSNGIGTIIIDLVKKILVNKPIKLASTFNAINFYLKRGFVKTCGNIYKFEN
jgi:hypothetical protein